MNGRPKAAIFRPIFLSVRVSSGVTLWIFLVLLKKAPVKIPDTPIVAALITAVTFKNKDTSNKEMIAMIVNNTTPYKNDFFKKTSFLS